MRRWRSPEELAETGLSRSRVLMVNEAHDHLRRCIRTRRVGARMIEPAHAAGTRHLAMEALTPDFAATANRDRRLGSGDGYLAQPELRDLMTAALEFGWSLIAYEADVPPGDPHSVPTANQRQPSKPTTWLPPSGVCPPTPSSWSGAAGPITSNDLCDCLTARSSLWGRGSGTRPG